MKLGVNIDHIATLRQARLPAGQKADSKVYPDPLRAAEICRRLNAHSVVMHLREDRRHIQDHDLFRVRQTVPIRLNLEMSIAPSVMNAAKKLKPQQATLVPEKRQERTTEGGLDLLKQTSKILKSVDVLKEKKIHVSLFIDPELKQVDMAKKMGAHAVEFHTGDYANQKISSGANRELKRLIRGTAHARALGLRAYAGHGLDYENVIRVSKIQGMEELNIGYSIVSRALWVGFENAVREMMGLLK